MCSHSSKPAQCLPRVSRPPASRITSTGMCLPMASWQVEGHKLPPCKQHGVCLLRSARHSILRGHLQDAEPFAGIFLSSDVHLAAHECAWETDERKSRTIFVTLWSPVAAVPSRAYKRARARLVGDAQRDGAGRIADADDHRRRRGPAPAAVCLHRRPHRILQQLKEPASAVAGQSVPDYRDMGTWARSTATM